MKVITNAQGLMETVDSEDEAEAERRKQATVRWLRAELRGMLDGNVQFHVDPYIKEHVAEKPVLKWILWSTATLASVGQVLIHCKDFDSPVNDITNAKFPGESAHHWDLFCVAAPGTAHYASFDPKFYQP
jgi:hypothetical protein